MLRRMSIVFIVFLLAVPLLAQDDAPVPTQAAPTQPAPTQDVQALNAAVATAQAAAAQANDAADAAGERTDQAFNLLGLFEAFGLVVTVIGAALGVFGFTRLLSAQNALTKARDEVKNELEGYRNRFENLESGTQQQLAAKQAEMQASITSQRENTSKALLANALLPLGERQYKAQDYEGALNTYERALVLDEANPVIHQRLGYVYTQKGLLDQAEYHYKRAIALEENFAPALAGLGFVYRRRGEEVERAMIQRAGGSLEDVPSDDLIARDKHYNKAEQLLLQALELSPKLVDDDGESWWGVMGGLYKRRGQIDQAIASYKQATTVTPQSSYGFGNLALLYLKKQDVDRMIKTYQRVERIAEREAQAETGNFWGYADLIVSLFAQGKVEQAERELPIAIEIAPLDSPYMLSGLSETLQELTVVVDDETRAALSRAIGTLESVKQERDKRNRDEANQPEADAPQPADAPTEEASEAT